MPIGKHDAVPHYLTPVGASDGGTYEVNTGALLARVKEFERTLGDWRERFVLTEDGREFVSIPVAFFDALLRKP
jgi:hypothetical protein